MFGVAPAIAIATATVGFVLANHWDYPPAQMTVAMQCAVVVGAWIARRARRGA
jgi:hypothetical protein